MKFNVNFEAEKAHLTALATLLFEKIMSVPHELRNDDKPRTGLQILVREIGTMNIVHLTVKEPSEQAKFFVIEKAVRSDIFEDVTAGKSKDSTKLRYQGSVTVTISGRSKKQMQVSVSGLQGEEDVVVSIKLLSYLCEIPSQSVMHNVTRNFGELPDSLFDENHYLYKILMEEVE